MNTLSSLHKNLLKLIPLMILLIAGCGGSGSGSGGGSTNPAPITVSGRVENLGPILGVTVTPIQVTPPSMDSRGTSAITDVSGQYSLNISSNTDYYLESSRVGFATTNTQFGRFTANQALDTIFLPTVFQAEAIIDTAFAGLMLNLADKAYLAVDAKDSAGVEVDGVAIGVRDEQSFPPDGGGALLCDGILSGSDLTVAEPPCSPVRLGPMYLAYYDTSTQVSINNSSNSEIIYAPVRVGEITWVTIDASSSVGGTGMLQVETEAGGRVTSNPPIIDCIGFLICSERAAAGTVVTLTATPFAGSKFTEWDGCDQMIATPDGGTCVVTIENNTTRFVRAEFDPR